VALPLSVRPMGAGPDWSGRAGRAAARTVPTRPPRGEPARPVSPRPRHNAIRI